MMRYITTMGLMAFVASTALANDAHTEHGASVPHLGELKKLNPAETNEPAGLHPTAQDPHHDADHHENAPAHADASHHAAPQHPQGTPAAHHNTPNHQVAEHENHEATASHDVNSDHEVGFVLKTQRLGHHGSFDRLVIEFESKNAPKAPKVNAGALEAGVSQIKLGEASILEQPEMNKVNEALKASKLFESVALDTHGSEVAFDAKLSSDAKDIKAFWMNKPARLVIDAFGQSPQPIAAHKTPKRSVASEPKVEAKPKPAAKNVRHPFDNKKYKCYPTSESIALSLSFRSARLKNSELNFIPVTRQGTAAGRDVASQADGVLCFPTETQVQPRLTLTNDPFAGEKQHQGLNVPVPAKKLKIKRKRTPASTSDDKTDHHKHNSHYLAPIKKASETHNVDRAKLDEELDTNSPFIPESASLDKKKVKFIPNFGLPTTTPPPHFLAQLPGAKARKLPSRKAPQMIAAKPAPKKATKTLALPLPAGKSEKDPNYLVQVPEKNADTPLLNLRKKSQQYGRRTISAGMGFSPPQKPSKKSK